MSIISLPDLHVSCTHAAKIPRLFISDVSSSMRSSDLRPRAFCDIKRMIIFFAGIRGGGGSAGSCELAALGVQLLVATMSGRADTLASTQPLGNKTLLSRTTTSSLHGHRDHRLDCSLDPPRSLFYRYLRARSKPPDIKDNVLNISDYM